MDELETLENEAWLNGDFADSVSLVALLYPVPEFEVWVTELASDLRKGLLDAEILEDLNRLITQENTHLEMHKSMNSQFDRLYNTKVLACSVSCVMKLMRCLPKGFQLWAAVVNEYLVAAASEDIINEHNLFESYPKNWGKALRWHSREEIEHKDSLHKAVRVHGYSPKWLLLVIPFVSIASLIGFYSSCIAMALLSHKHSIFAIFCRRHFRLFWSLEEGVFRKHTKTMLSMLNRSWTTNKATQV